ncbi:hypothetical protein AAA799N04_00065 [Marine Group I thaumarchaeote SCGC AAA799-N04]|uniref:Uncharacterized protein n=1 Tax=Marine Group I thaumarchaeote SCGC AAA799-N04 TaxID=1502293 RepID=A0A081RQB5_9ARCH|nr:hypothetical protein AAA799N04_00065 [Marine Group I thaumarchaeote SCGC AAA799-N04]
MIAPDSSTRVYSRCPIIAELLAKAGALAVTSVLAEIPVTPILTAATAIIANTAILFSLNDHYN